MAVKERVVLPDENEMSLFLNKSYLCNGLPPKTRSGQLIEVVEFCAYIDGAKITVREEPEFITYTTPKFITSGSVRFPSVDDGELWVLGFVQACTHMRFFNTYKTGFSSWEFPEMIFGERDLISDSNGFNHPWYGTCKEIIGPNPEPATHCLRLEDHFFPRISWKAPIGGRESDYLQRTERYQGFFTWLTAFDLNNKSFYPLRAVYWEMASVISIDPSKPLGSRAYVEPRVASQPFIYDVNRMPPLTYNALYPPCANAAQALIFRSLINSNNNSDYSPPHVVVLPFGGKYQKNANNFENFQNRLVSNSWNVIEQYQNPVQPYRQVPMTTSKPPAIHVDYSQKHRNWMRNLFQFIDKKTRMKTPENSSKRQQK